MTAVYVSVPHFRLPCAWSYISKARCLQYLIIILKLKQTFGSLSTCVLSKVTYKPSGNLDVRQNPVWTFSFVIPKCTLEIESTTFFKAVCLRQDLRPEIGSGYFLMHAPWTSLLLLEVMESNADTHKVSRCNWIENYREIKKDSKRRRRQRKGHKLSDSRESLAQVLLIRAIYK